MPINRARSASAANPLALGIRERQRLPEGAASGDSRLSGRSSRRLMRRFRLLLGRFPTEQGIENLNHPLSRVFALAPKFRARACRAFLWLTTSIGSPN